jgi:hypothetical protein
VSEGQVDSIPKDALITDSMAAYGYTLALRLVSVCVSKTSGDLPAWTVDTRRNRFVAAEVLRS